ncbi:type I polyketide synthase [Sciscionella marina]|uniref:type I polyketide synthase n=1 Tax=Sciscionella marina TaxID=508770 RepID=UPI00036B9834|nr:type I polyketide synthase [Sciscionella marina]
MTTAEDQDSVGDIAIVGMAGIMPGAPDLAAFWADLCAGRDGITRMTREELRTAGVPAELADDPAFVPAAGVLPGIDRFDAAFFGYDRGEAELLDPQHRLFLECAWHALEDGGIDPDRLDGLVGVFAGGAPSSYLLTNLLANDEIVHAVGPDQLMQINEKDLIASRLSYALNLGGPSMSVQSCSSTALVVLAQAATSLLTGESDVVVAGAVSIVVPQIPGYLYHEGSRLAPDGVNRVLDAGANGKVPGNGLGVVVMRRLEDALADGDRIYSVLRGWAVNHEGSAGRRAFNLPGVPGQAAVIEQALAAAGVGPEDIDHVECDVIGTPFGDAAELSALQRVFDVEGVDQVTLGASDGNTGHINQAAGIARVLKASLELYHEKRVPAVHFEQPSDQIAHAHGRLTVQTGLGEWPRGERPRLAGVTAYGFGGTDAHLVLQEAPVPEETERPPARPHQVLVWSARTAAAADAATTRLRESSAEWTDLADVAYTLQFGRKAFGHRRMATVSSVDDAAAALGSDTRMSAGAEVVSRRAGLLLAGVGEQYSGMAGGLYRTEPEFRAAIEECSALFRAHLGFDPVASLVGERAGNGNDLARLLGRETGPESADTTVVQPGVFSIGYALGRLLRAWGIEPEVIAGYSVGEFAAATLAGSLTLEEAAGLVAARARLIARLPAGAMAALPLSATELGELAGDSAASGVEVAAVNGPRMTVVSGSVEAVAKLTEKLAGNGVPARPLRTTHAFHSRALRPVAAELTAWARANLDPRTPDVPYLSNVTGEPITTAQLRDPGYWSEHMCRPVQFSTMIRQLATEHPSTVLVELGAGQSLGSMFRGHPDFPRTAWEQLVPSLPGEADPKTDTETLTEALGRLWLSGVDLDWGAYHAGRAPRKTSLPGYVFDHQSYWVEPSPHAAGIGFPSGVGEQRVFLVDTDTDEAGRALATRVAAELGAELVFGQDAERVRREHGRLDGVLDLTTVGNTSTGPR